MIKFSNEHVWLSLDGEPANGLTATVGITPHAQDTLGDIVFVDLPAIGAHFAQAGVAGVVESVKAAADVHMPVDGDIVEVNEALRADPSLANTEPMGAGWFFKIKLSNPAQVAGLFDEAAYEAFRAQ